MGTKIQVEEVAENTWFTGSLRLYVHLSSTIETAINVGTRHGIPVVFKVDTQKMFKDGAKFYLSRNGVWLTDYVATEYLSLE